MARHHLPGAPETFIRGQQTNETVNRKLGGIVLNQLSHPIQWFIMFGIGAMVMQALAVTVVWLLYKGIGIWGVNQPSGWGFDIINFVWWIGIGHAGTLISAILLLLRQQWRTSINRFAEAMTIFAVMCAGMYPLLHTGRPWVAYWLMPIGPNVLGMWPQFRSPLVWDVFAVSTYLTVSVLFWFTGLIPDLGMLRDRAKNKLAKMAYGLPAMGWRGSAKHWFRYEQAYLILAGLSAPLVLSVHTIVSFDFAVSILPGWHTTIFPPYFVAGAVYAGFAMVLTLALPVRYWYNVKDFITMNHIDWMAKIMLATGLVVFYGYLLEIFFAFYSGNQFEIYMMKNRMTGPYWPLYWSLIACNGLVPQLLWSKKVRHNLPVLFMICCVVSIGMWLERFIIIPVSLHRDFLPSSWGMYIPSLGDWTMFIGTIGFFIMMMFLFIRFLPFIPIFEMKDLLNKMNSHHEDGHADAHGGEDTHGGGNVGRTPTPSPVPAGGE